MSELEKFSGLITYNTYLSSTSGYVNTSLVDGDISGYIGTKHWSNFRVNNIPCRMKGTPNMNIGDQVTVVGNRKGELNVLVLYNETTKVRYTVKVVSLIGYYIGIICSIILNGISLLFIFAILTGLQDPKVSFLFLPLSFFLIFGLIFLFVTVRNYKSRKDLNNAIKLINN